MLFSVWLASTYEWNDLDAAERYGQQSLEMARLYDRVIDRFIVSELFLARLKLAQGDLNRAAEIVAQAEQSALQNNFVFRIPEVAAAQALVLLQQGRLVEAAQLAQAHALPALQVRVHLAQGDSSAALAILEPLLQEMAARGWQDERLKLMVLQAVALHATVKKTGLCSCWARRWRWQSRAASSVSSSMKAPRWSSYCPQQLLMG